MKKLLTLTAFLLSNISYLTSVYAQNVGVDVASPVEKLDVLGAIRIGTTSNTNAGTIRWNSPNFQGYDGTQWVNFGGAAGWSLTGNSGTVAGTNFIGTTDNVNLLFRVFNQPSGLIDNASYLTFFGYQAGMNTTGIKNSAFGYNALLNNASGEGNTAVGTNALMSNTTAYRNTAIGTDALKNNTSGSYNVAVGKSSLEVNTTGFDNTATGVNALFANSSGSSNTAIGREALFSNTSGQYNTGVGVNALQTNGNGINNTSIGALSLQSNSTGVRNTASGALSLYYTTGSYNAATGAEALYWNTSGSYNTANGYNTLLTNTTGSYNTGLGYNTDVSANNLSNATAVGANAIVNASNKVQIGDGAVTAVQLGTGTNVTLETGLVKITGGTPAAGEVLTSDAVGLATWSNPSTLGFVSGSGTATRLAFWSGTSALSSSANLYWDNTNSRLGVGITNPLGVISAGSTFGNKVLAYDDGTNAAGLGIQAGAFQLFTSNNTSNIVFGYGSSGSFTENMRIMGTGNVGIGTVSPVGKLHVYETGTALAGWFQINNSGSSNSAVAANSNGSGSTIYSTNNGWGRAGSFEINNSSSDRFAIYAATNGIGPAIYADKAGSTGNALKLQTGSSTNSSPTIYSNTFGTGYAGEFRIDNSGSSSAALYASTSGTGPAIEAAGKTKTTTFQMTNSPTVNYVLRSDASGNATWVNPNTLVTGLLPTGTTAQTLRHDGTNWVANSVMVNNGTNVGIGTTAPDYKLHVSGSDYLTLKLVAPNYPLLKLSGSYNSGNGAEFWQDNTGDARLNINGTVNAIYMKSTGDVGIGMVFPATPAARLDVNNGASTVPIFVARDNGTEVMRIADGGNVGIGTTAPTEKLDVLNGNLTVRTNANGTTAKIIISGARNGGNIGWNNTAGTGHSILEFVNYDGGNSATFYTSGRIESANQPGSDDGDLRFYTSSDMVLQEVMRMDNTGNVGIGQEPTQKLDVNGKIRMRTGASTGYVPVSDVNGTMTWTAPASLGAGGTLDYAYDFGGAGLGRTITADAGDVLIQGVDGFRVTGTFGSGATIGSPGAGARMFYNPRKAAFRAGSVNGTQWDDSNVGNYSTAFGANTTANGVLSFATGGSSTASGQYGVAMGSSTTASGWAAAAFNEATTAESAFETVFGTYNTDYTPNSTTTFNSTDRLFVIGNGTGSGSRSDAVVVLKNGNTGMGTSAPAQVLDVNGKIQMRTGASTGYVPVSDASGTMTWTSLSSLNIDQIHDADNNTKVQVEQSPNEDIIRFTAAGTQLYSMRKIAGGSPWLEVNSTNTLIGSTISTAINGAGTYNTAVGYQAAQSLTTGQKNAYYGDNAGGSNTTGNNNTMIGTVAGQFNNGGGQNTMIGGYAGRNNLTGSGNVFLGFGAGENETGSDKLYIDNSNTTSPLIQGDFSTNILAVNGNVGIGTSTPGAYLDITGTNAGTTSLQLRSGNTGLGTTSNQIVMGFNGAETYRHTIKTRHSSSGAANNAIDFYVWKYGTDASGTVGTEQVMTLDGSNGGSVGIGTTTPIAPLDVRRSADTDGDAIAFGTPTYYMGRLGETATTNKVYIANTYNSDASYIDFRLKGNAESNSKMIIKGDGNVGLGTTSPSATLDVVGTVEMFGAWTSKSANTVYQADRDGFIVAWAGSGYFTVLTDGSNPPTTTRMEAEGATANAARPNIMCPVRKGDYWKVNGASGGTPTVWWMPMGQ